MRTYLDFIQWLRKATPTFVVSSPGPLEGVAVTLIHRNDVGLQLTFTSTLAPHQLQLVYRFIDIIYSDMATFQIGQFSVPFYVVKNINHVTYYLYEVTVPAIFQEALPADTPLYYRMVLPCKAPLSFYPQFASIPNSQCPQRLSIQIDGRVVEISIPEMEPCLLVIEVEGDSETVAMTRIAQIISMATGMLCGYSMADDLYVFIYGDAACNQLSAFRYYRMGHCEGNCMIPAYPEPQEFFGEQKLDGLFGRSMSKFSEQHLQQLCQVLHTNPMLLHAFGCFWSANTPGVSALLGYRNFLHHMAACTNERQISKEESRDLPRVVQKVKRELSLVLSGFKGDLPPDALRALKSGVNLVEKTTAPVDLFAPFLIYRVPLYDQDRSTIMLLLELDYPTAGAGRQWHCQDLKLATMRMHTLCLMVLMKMLGYQDAVFNYARLFAAKHGMPLSEPFLRSLNHRQDSV